MKKIFLIALAFVTIQVSAQNQGERKGDRMNDFTPEEMAQLQTKKMTLALDLTDAQQKQVEKLQLENAKERQALRETRQLKKKDGTGKPNKEERLAMMNERLDKQIEMKEKMKQILNEDQFEKWKKMQGRKGKKFAKNNKGERKQKQ